METKKSVLKKVKSTGKPPYNGQYGYNLAFANGDEGLVNCPTDQVGTIGLIEGKEISYSIQEKPSKSGGKWNLITLVNSDSSQNNHSETPNKNANVQRAIIYQNAFTQAGTFFNIRGYSQMSEQESLKKLCDTADYIAEHIIKKSGV